MVYSSTMQQLGIAVLAGLGGMLGWGIADLFAKKTIDEIGDITTLVLAHIFGAILVAAVALYAVASGSYTFAIPASLNVWLGFGIFGALQAAVYLLVYIGFGKGQVAVLNPIFSSFSGVVALVSILFLGELVTPWLALGLIAVFVGVMLMNVDVGALRNRRISFLAVPGFFEVAGATVLATIWTLGWNGFVHGHDWLGYTIGMYLAMTLTLLIYAYVRGVSLAVPHAAAWKYLIGIGVFESGAYVAISWGYGATSALSVVAVLSGAFSLPTIIGARAWLKEQTTAAQLWGSAAIVCGVVAIALA